MKKYIIAIDAGHCIHTPGRRCLKKFDPEEHREWWLNNRIAKYIQERAKKYEGFEVLRVDDASGEVDVKLATRCAKANSAGAAFFLSIHHNGGIEGGSGGGLVAFSYPNSAVGAEWRDGLYNAVLSAGKLRGNRAAPKTTANFAVLRETNMPAVLIEHGFMDSSVDVPVIISEAYAKACGYAEADYIAKKLGMKLKETEPSKDETEDDEEMTKEAFKELMKQYRAELQDNDHGEWSDEAINWAIEAGLMAGGTPNKDGTPNYMHQDFITREQVFTVLYRFAKMIGVA